MIRNPPQTLKGPFLKPLQLTLPAVTDGQLHTLSVELMTYQGGTNGAREYVVAQAKQACDSINQEVYIENLTSETTWRGGRAELTFACVDKSDSRLKQ